MPSSSNDSIFDSIRNAFGSGDDFHKMSPLNQVLVGSVTGLATGYVLSRVGKLAAFSIGTGVIVLQVAQHMGYIEVKWKKGNSAKSSLEEMKKKAIKAAEDYGLKDKKSTMDKLVEDTKSFFQNNVTFGVSFGGGVLLGISI